jgi:hypothetical protein
MLPVLSLVSIVIISKVVLSKAIISIVVVSLTTSNKTLYLHEPKQPINLSLKLFYLSNILIILPKEAAILSLKNVC